MTKASFTPIINVSIFRTLHPTFFVQITTGAWNWIFQENSMNVQTHDSYTFISVMCTSLFSSELNCSFLQLRASVKNLISIGMSLILHTANKQQPGILERNGSELLDVSNWHVEVCVQVHYFTIQYSRTVSTCPFCDQKTWNNRRL